MANKVWDRGIALATGIAALTLALPAVAQDILGQGKTGAQLFASNCAICHKSPAGMTRAGGLFGVSSFLQQHYTSSRETAAAIAAYLESVDRAAPPASKSPPRRGTRGDDDKGRPTTRKPSSAKPADAKPADAKPADVKPAEAKPAAEAPKAAEAKPAEMKPAETKPVEAKPAEAKPAEPKPEN